MQRLDADGLDPSQFLPRGVPPVNAYRAAKGDLLAIVDEEEHFEGVKSITWMPDRLYHAGKIAKEQVDTCQSFYIAVIATRKTLGICDLRGVLIDKLLQTVVNIKDVDIFLSVMRQLKKPEANMMLWLVDHDYNRNNMELACHLIGTIKHAIDNTQNILDRITEAAKMEKSSCAEPRPDFTHNPRPAG